MASKKPSGLGRGLGALLGDDAVKAESSGSLYLPISQVESCSSQPRKHFDPESLQELADSITEHGIIQPLTVRRLASGYYQIIAGERRWRAARLAGLTEVPVIVMEADDRKAAELAMIENLQREHGGKRILSRVLTKIAADSNDQCNADGLIERQKQRIRYATVPGKPL